MSVAHGAAGAVARPAQHLPGNTMIGRGSHLLQSDRVTQKMGVPAAVRRQGIGRKVAPDSLCFSARFTASLRVFTQVDEKPIDDLEQFRRCMPLKRLTGVPTEIRPPSAPVVGGLPRQPFVRCVLKGRTRTEIIAPPSESLHQRPPRA